MTATVASIRAEMLLDTGQFNRAARQSGQTVSTLGRQIGTTLPRSLAAHDRALSRTSAMYGRTTRDFQVMYQNAQRLQTGVGRLGGTLASFGVLLGGVNLALTARSVARYADSYKSLQNQLRVVITNTRELQQANEDLFGVSQETRSGLEATIGLYTRLNRSTKGLERTQADLLRATKAVQQALVISGSTTQEANAAAIQLGQGLASDRLQGDELRSILENAPRLAIALADALGVGIGELRKMGSEGELTRDRVFPALLSQADILAEEFGRTEVTISQGLTVLNNALTQYVGQMDRATGASTSFASFLRGTADNIDAVALSLATLGAAALGTFGGRRLGRAVEGTRARTDDLRREVAEAQGAARALQAERREATAQVARSGAVRRALSRGDFSADPQLERKLQRYAAGITTAAKNVEKARGSVNTAMQRAADPKPTRRVEQRLRAAENQVRRAAAGIQRAEGRVGDLQARIAQLRADETAARGTINRTETAKLYRQLDLEAQAFGRAESAATEYRQALAAYAAARDTRITRSTQGQDTSTAAAAQRDAQQRLNAVRVDLAERERALQDERQASDRTRDELQRSSDSRATRVALQRIETQERLRQATERLANEQSRLDDAYVSRQQRKIDVDRALDEDRQAAIRAQVSGTERVADAERRLQTTIANRADEIERARRSALDNNRADVALARERAAELVRAEERIQAARRATRVQARVAAAAGAVGRNALAAVGGVPGLTLVGLTAGITALAAAQAKARGELQLLREAGDAFLEQMGRIQDASEQFTATRGATIEAQLALDTTQAREDVERLREQIVRLLRDDEIVGGRIVGAVGTRNVLRNAIGRLSQENRDITSVLGLIDRLRDSAALTDEGVIVLTRDVAALGAVFERLAEQTEAANAQLAQAAAASQTASEATVSPDVREGLRTNSVDNVLGDSRRLFEFRNSQRRGTSVLEAYEAETAALARGNEERRLAAEIESVRAELADRNAAASIERVEAVAAARLDQQDALARAEERRVAAEQAEAEAVAQQQARLTELAAAGQQYAESLFGASVQADNLAAILTASELSIAIETDQAEADIALLREEFGRLLTDVFNARPGDGTLRAVGDLTERFDAMGGVAEITEGDVASLKSEIYALADAAGVAPAALAPLMSALDGVAATAIGAANAIAQARAAAVGAINATAEDGFAPLAPLASEGGEFTTFTEQDRMNAVAQATESQYQLAQDRAASAAARRSRGRGRRRRGRGGGGADTVKRMAEALERLRREADAGPLDEFDRKLLSTIESLGVGDAVLRQVIETLRQGGDVAAVNPLFGEVEELLRTAEGWETYRRALDGVGNEAQEAAQFQSFLNQQVAAGAISANDARMAWSGFVQDTEAFKPVERAVDSFVDSVGDAILEFDRLDEIAGNFLQTLARIVLETMVLEPLAESLKGVLSGGPGDGGGSGGGGGGGFLGALLGGLGSAFGFRAHEGTIHGAPEPIMVDAQAFHGAARHHSGLQADEFRAVLKRGEQVLTGADTSRVMRTVAGLSNARRQPLEIMVRAEEGEMFRPVVEAVSRGEAVKVTQAGLQKYDQEQQRTLFKRVSSAQQQRG